MLLHIEYHDGGNPFVSLGDLAPADCFRLYRRKVREYARTQAAAPPPLFMGDPVPDFWTRRLPTAARVHFTAYNRSGAFICIKNVWHGRGPVLWAAYVGGRLVGCYYTTPGRAWAALQKIIA